MGVIIMKTKLKSMKKMTAMFIAALMILSIFGTGFKALAASAETIAAWDYTAAAESADVPATSGTHAAGAVLSNFQGIAPATSSNSWSLTGWDGGAGIKYWQISLSTKGYESLTLSAKTRSSGTGPRDFKVVYSIDNGANWADVPNSAYAITSTTLGYFMHNPLLLPAEASNVEKLLIRFIMTSNISSRAGTTSGTRTYPADEVVASTGTSQINNIVVQGIPVTNDQTVGTVTAAPVSGSQVVLGSKVVLACETADASIMYSINDSAFVQYDPALQITLSALPVTIKAYGTKTGMTNSTTSAFTYTQAQAAPVTANPNGGAVNLSQQVTLACATPNASIKYSIDGGTSWNDYKAPVALPRLPATVKAKATAEGYLDSAESIFNFTQKVVGEFNTYFGQLHSHTNYSDGVGTPDDAYSHAKNVAKVDFLAVTDHSNSLDNAGTSSMADGSKSTEWVNGHAIADKYTDSSFVGIYGFEMTWTGGGTGHINTFNTPGFETRENQIYKNADGLKQYYDVLKQFPASISQLNHPGNTFGDFNDFANYDPQIDNEINLIEVGNGEGTIGSSGYFPSYDYFTRALDKGWHVSPTNNQDNHLGKWGDANTARTVVLADSLTRDNIYDAMRNMRTYATEDNDLRIKYTLNGEIMGTILSQKPAGIDIKVDLEDPDNEALGKVSVISNGGKVVASKTLTNSKDSVEFNLAPDYSYYYIRVDEADKDIAVTAPVWVGEVDKAGISKTTVDTTPVKGQKLTVTTQLYNNENADMNISSLEYSIEGTIINTAPAIAAVKSLGTGSYFFDYTPAKAGKFNIDVNLKATINGVEKIFTDVLKLNVMDPSMLTRVVIDASHCNDYVSGYYANNMKNIVTLGNDESFNVILQKDKLTDDVLKDTQLLILSPPGKKTTTDRNSGVNYVTSPYTDEEIAVIANYANHGGNIIVTSLADYQDNRDDSTNHSAFQQNRILQAIGAGSRINDDEIVDYDNNPNVQPAGTATGTPYRVPMNAYNTSSEAVSQYLKGVAAEQNYSFYSGCSITPGNNATWIVKGTPTTYGFDSDNDKLGGSYVAVANQTIPADTGIGKGNVAALAAETLPGGGKLFIGGTVFYSDFEIKYQLDNASQLQNSNYNITMNILDSIKKVIPVTPIAKVRSAQNGDAFCVEGTVTAGTAQGNAFFDTIYIQDSTGGINLFPVSGADIKVGQKVRVTGALDEYQGDKELRVIDCSVIDSSINPIAPALMTTRDAMDSQNGGMLIKVQGTVTKVDITNNVIQAVYVKDQSGVEARLFIDGYIGYSDENSPKLDDIAKVGNIISGIGLASTDTNGNRLRVRDRSEFILIKTAEQVANEAATLPKTGSPIDFSTVAGFGGILIVFGSAMFIYERRKESRKWQPYKLS
jgi:Predicted metal-dependent phosphoesterases (PHP family)